MNEITEEYLDEILADHSFMKSFNILNSTEEEKNKLHQLMFKYSPKTISMYNKVPAIVFKKQLKNEFIDSLEKGIQISRVDLNKYEVVDHRNSNKNNINEYEIICLKLINGKIIEIDEEGKEVSEIVEVID